MICFFIYWGVIMFRVSNYYEQSRTLPVQNSFQLMILQWADAATLLREGSKMGTAIGLVSSAASVVFNFNPTTALTCTAVCGLTWVLSRTCAQKLEPRAQNRIQYFKNVRDGKDW